MFAVIKTGGKQYRVAADDVLTIEKIAKGIEKLGAILGGRGLWGKGGGMVGVYYDDPNAVALKDLRSHAGAILPGGEALPEGLEEVRLPEGRYACLRFKGPYAGLQSAYDYLFGPWLAGARAVLARPGGHRDSSYLAQLIGERRLTVAHFVPSMLRLFLEEDLAHCDGLRLVFSGGEALAADLRDRFFARLRAALHNQYGPTEASIDVTHRICRREDGGQPVPLGRPIDNTRIYLLDPAVHPVPPGVPGELCVGGENLARGYLHRPDLTAERFLPDPLSGLAGERLYRTGDLARHLPTGEIEFLGRIDHQIKVRGFRIEVEEVEREIARASGVREAAVAIRGDAAEARLVAWVVPGPAGSPSVAELREALRSRLPEFMVPNLWVTMPGLPRSPNGKIDRRALPDAGALHLVEASPQTWRSPTEELVARVWEDVLGLAQVGPGDDFFALGGHSLLATRVISRLRQALGFDLPLRALFEAPTVAQLAAAAEAARRAGAGIDLPPLAPAPRDGDLPLSFAQQRLWFLDQLEPGNPAYNIPSALRLTGDLRVDLLRATLAALVARHESLRTVFASVRGTPVQVIRAPFHPATGLVDLSSLPAARGEQEAHVAVTLTGHGLKDPDTAIAQCAEGKQFVVGSNR